MVQSTAGSDASAAIQQRKKDGGFVGYARKIKNDNYFDQNRSTSFSKTYDYVER